MASCDLSTYTCSDKGFLMPFISEYTWDDNVRAFLYILGLLYCFLGVSIVADIFMRSIEMITSKTSTVRIADPTSTTGYRELKVKVWNDTVANLTLMALGSSAPAILLSIIEVARNQVKAGSLGPGTIVGSAALIINIVWNDTVANLTLMALGSSAPAILLSIIKVVGNQVKAGDLGLGTIVWNDTVANLTLMASGSSAPAILLSIIEVARNQVKAGNLSPATIVGSIALIIIISMVISSIISTITTEVWNDTVANLTLMALGSSAPEILLSIIEVVGNKFKAGDLGPGTIVGSAAFNLLVITAVCMVSIPDKEGRRIKVIKVFIVTAIFSVFAYVWLLIVLVVITPDYVDLWEAVVTFLFFPLLVVIAYMTDKDYCVRKSSSEGAEIGELGMDKDTIHGTDAASKEVITDILRKIGHRPNVSEDDEAKIAAAMVAHQTPHSRAWYRINAIRNLSGGTKLTPPVNEKQSEIMNSLLHGENIGSTVSLLSEDGDNAVVQWATSSSAVLEMDGSVSLKLLRTGNTNNRVMVRVETIDGTAEAESDYIPVKETVVFEAGVTAKSIEVKIVDDTEWEPDEVFFARVLMADTEQACVVGTRAITQIVILNDDNPGTFEFPEPSVVVKESVGTVQIPVARSDGADGRVELLWEATNQTAVYGQDYDTNKGTIVFEHGEMSKSIQIGIIDDQEFEKDEHFEVTLLSCNVPGAKIGRLRRTIVTILNDDEFQGLVSRVVNMTNTNLDMLRLQKASWGQQFKEALNVNGGEVESASSLDYFMHFLTFGWKVVFACVPPVGIWGGWLAFFLSLMMIGVLTTFIQDLASIFGCLVGLKDMVTAITLVALGTSLPDLFASRQAALQERYADNSIGNVTGSNSVNVFLGLGVSWIVASIYWSAKGKTFEVPAGSLSFSVVLYSICAIVAIIILLLRRCLPVFGKAELGGGTGGKWFTALLFIGLWLAYITLSILQAYEILVINF